MAAQLNPEQRARVEIDRMLEAAGWVIQDYKDADFAAAPGERQFGASTLNQVSSEHTRQAGTLN
jgi:type I site-specific restriction endonuclease